jgi:hypothetical protein
MEMFCMRKLQVPGEERKKYLVIFATFAIFYQGIERLSLICQAGNLPARGKPKKNETSPGNFMLHLLRKSS